MILRFSSPIAGVALAASTHGISDALTPMKLWTYAIVPLPLPFHASSVLFCASSIFHFGEDIGFIPSVLLHGSLLVCSKINFEAACTLMCIYYSCVHVPLHLIKIFKSSILCFFIIAISTLALLPFTYSTTDFRIGEWMQRLVVAHILSTIV